MTLRRVALRYMCPDGSCSGLANDSENNMPQNRIERRSPGLTSLIDGGSMRAKRNSDVVLSDDDLIVKPAVG
jgi:hypothetical protein